MFTSCSVADHVVQRQAHEKRKEKNALAAEIEGDPLANDDDPAHDELPEWIPSTLTGGTSERSSLSVCTVLNLMVADDALNDSTYAEERINFLIKFIAHRDGYDVRPELRAGELGLEGLEEIYIEGLNPDEAPKAKDKGKGKFDYISRLLA
jgi:hypothetical protein